MVAWNSRASPVGMEYIWCDRRRWRDVRTRQDVCVWVVKRKQKTSMGPEGCVHSPLEMTGIESLKSEAHWLKLLWVPGRNEKFAIPTVIGESRTAQLQNGPFLRLSFLFRLPFGLGACEMDCGPRPG